MRFVLRLLISIALTGLSKSITQIGALKYFKYYKGDRIQHHFNASNFTNSGLPTTDEIIYKNYQ